VAACGIDRDSGSSSLTLMARAKPPANASSPPAQSFRWLADASTRGVAQGTRDTVAAKSCAPERRSCRCTPDTGWAALADGAMATIWRLSGD
jgi:hypothetical protein